MKQLLIYAFILCLAPQLSAQIPSEVISEIDKRVATDNYPSIVIGYYKDGKASYYAAGYQDEENKTKASEETLYEIGSISKTFTSLLLAKLATENKLTIEDPIARYLPDTLKLKDKAGTEITFRHLSTHTSGLLRLPFGYNPDNWSNPYLGYHRDNLFLYLSNFEPGEVGTTNSYSNLAVGLLGETLAIIEDVPYKTLIQEQILNPLGLQHTYFEIPEDQQVNFAIPYAKGKAVSSWEFDVLAPAGALRADIKDLISYGVSYLNKHELSEAQAMTTQQHFEIEEGRSMGLAWFKDKNRIFHGGGTGGFLTHLEIDIENNAVAAVMTNTADNNASDLVSYILDPEENPLFNEETSVIEISEEALELYTGNYSNEQFGLNFVVSVINKTLHVKLNSQNAVPAEYIGNDTFQNDKVKAQLLFTMENGATTALTLSQGGQKIKCKKI